ncbi:50S ribosomal protein L9 [Candidatus Uhrbacteria bacterium CG10_big_fil_rev_8_21_14_0_10_48_11]|uniref:Large ribosomal subunit protein bL9 n=1 Tax=Candidatus Uhrbacteria bacterium CG10_big_fil_rev_8_21_14_0_10_48_11 TaxID=1975037 RepID=A0A2M8LEH0_9BACT|nr:MAG: 50S ribosomal protein L9 [Candidatus Uhrbacteria bacterium CG10_big_fil_rev_8_21_14_0_10_48_11]
MRVILKKNVPSLGVAGSIREVREGYARNYLVANGLAEPASTERVKVLKTGMAQQERGRVMKQQKMASVLERISGKAFSLKKKSNDQGTLFSAVHPQEIVALLVGKKFFISEADIKLAEPIKTIGKHPIVISVPKVGEVTIYLSVQEQTYL